MTGAEFAANCITYKGVREGTAKHHEIIDTYNKIKPLPRGYKMTYTDSWCAAFISAMAYKCGVTDKISCECGAHNMYEAMCTKKVSRNKGEIGDIIFYDFNGDNWVDHVGIILDKNGKTYSVLEGNKSHAVGVRTIDTSNCNIFAVCRPNWDTQVSGGKSVETVAVEVIQGKWGNGADRKTRLTAAGYDYSSVQKAVNKMLKK